jgi:hypothetical protein
VSAEEEDFFTEEVHNAIMSLRGGCSSRRSNLSVNGKIASGEE